jgi:NAD(P)-dependent dehydrogenase (short-subunit alcohol dehydrogenase family)
MILIGFYLKNNKNTLNTMLDKSNALLGKTAVVTGAGGQLGTQLSIALAKQGVSVWATDINLDAATAVVSQLTQISDIKHHAAIMDVTEKDSVQSLMHQVKESAGNVDILINNAGISVFTDFFLRTKEEFMKVTEVNLFGTMLCVQQAAEIMKQTGKGGAIINLGSIYGMVSGDPRIYTDCARNTAEVYAATKAGVIQMTKYFAIHLANYNIRVNAISPGGIFNNQGEDFVNNYSARTPMSRMADESEIVGAVLFLSDSSQSSYITGQNIAIDGGFTSW